MKAFYAIDYTIHFDDTMAYGGHHFLTAFKLQCASREAFLFGEHLFDQPGVKQALAGVHLLTSDAYARNLQSMQLGDRVAIFLTLEDWGRASARFCYRVLDHRGNKVCAGFQTLICADAASGDPLTLPTALRQAMDQLRDIEEHRSGGSFRDIVLAGGTQLDEIFGETERQLAIEFLSDRYPRPGVIHARTTHESHHTTSVPKSERKQDASNATAFEPSERHSFVSQVWAFAGQGAFDATLFCQRLGDYRAGDAAASEELRACGEVAQEYFGEAAAGLFSASKEACLAAIRTEPGLSQIGILLQNVLGARLCRHRGQTPAMLMGHSFGEIAAFQVAGCFDLATAIRIVCLRSEAIERHAPPRSGLLAVFAERHVVRTEASMLGLSKVRIAGRNHDTQTIASGPLDQLENLHSHFRQRGIQSTRISSPTSFHHPDLDETTTHWLESMRQLPLQRPTVPIYTPIGRRLIAETDDPATVLASQLVQPFDLQGAIHDLAAMGIKELVDCGSTGSLAKLITQAAGDLIEVCCAAIPELPSVSDNEDARNFDSHHSTFGDGIPESRRRRNEERRLLPTTAIVGRGCILPAGARTPEDLFISVMQQRIGLVDQRTLDPHWTEDFYSEKLVPDRSTSHLWGRVEDADVQCPSDVDTRLFQAFTRTQKLLCIALSPCISGLRDAERIVCLMGATADGFEDQDEVTSLIFAGIDPSEPDVDRLMKSARSAHQTPHQAIQEVLDQLVGPGIQVILVDAACASSLYTTALGMRLLETDQADAVIAGGVFCPGPGNSCLFSQFRGTTSTGCRPFDANANGVVFSEGAAILTLRRAADASRFGLKANAVIRGAGLSSDGRSSSANVPQSHGQILSLQRCYRRYEIDPATINGIEGHGTSTPVGDSTEVETLMQFFASHVTTPIPLHSLKGSIGHAGWAAGTASVIAACEYLNHQTFPAQGFYREPSKAVTRAGRVLAVSTEPTSLQSKQRRIAVDGFGFGGANAHLVLENIDSETCACSDAMPKPDARESNHNPQDQEIVVVALHQIEPTLDSQTGYRFDRDAVKIPENFIILPDLADDMDISQTLTVGLAHQIIDGLSDFNDELRNETCVVLAMNGKTERGVEATTRVLSQRLKRNLSSEEKHVESIEQAYRCSRPSKAYTLQCMMPNVAAGRAALLLNLRGPNFVVDSGERSLDAALLSASLLMENEGVGAKVAIVATVSASTGSDPYCLGRPDVEEYAAAFALTTRSLANQKGWKPLAGLSQVRQHLQSLSGSDSLGRLSASQIRSLIQSIHGSNSQENVEATPLHTPIWVEKPYPSPVKSSTVPVGDDLPAAILIVPADPVLVDELRNARSDRFSQARILVVGENASHVVARHPESDLHVAADLDQPDILAELVRSFPADLIIAVQRPRCQDFQATLQDVAQDNGLCEALFLVAQNQIERLNAGSVEMWSLVLDGWTGEVHPSSGATAGLLKSIRREIPDASMATICTADLTVAQAFDALLAERSHGVVETELVFDGRMRWVRRLMPIEYRASPSPQVMLNAESVVVASGGARGVTAVMLDAIARDFACTIIALGRSPLETGPDDCDDPGVEQRFYREFIADHPGVSANQMRREFEATRARWEAARNVQYLRSLGANVEYHVVDVTSEEDVSRVIADIAQRYGRVDFLIHGAGVQVSKKLQHRSLAEFRNTFQVKVKGLHLLVRSCFEHFGELVNTHVLTSAYSVFGNDGQHDYCAANETMDRLCAFCRQSTENQWTSIAWLAWDGIGMTRGSEYRALAKQRSLSGVDEPTGKRLFRAVISGRTGVAINVPLSNAEHTKYCVATLPKDTSELPGRWRETQIDLTQSNCLSFHKVRESPTLPGAWILEHFVESASKLFPHPGRFGEVRMRDIAFHRFVRLVNGQSPNLRVIAKQREDLIDVWMIADLIHSSGQLLAKDVVCARAKIRFSESSARFPTLLDPGCGPRPGVLDDPYCRTDATVELSGPFQCLQQISIDRELRRAFFDGESSDDWPTIIPALALDAAWRVGAMYADAKESSLFVPVNIEEAIVLLGAGESVSNPKKWTIVSTNPNVDHDGARWSRTEVCDATGQVVILVKNAYARLIN